MIHFVSVKVPVKINEYSILANNNNINNNNNNNNNNCVWNMQLVYVNSIFAVIGINMSGMYSYGDFHSVSPHVSGMWV